MTRFALKALLGRKLRTVLSAFAIVLGVATVSGTYVLTDSIDKAFGSIFTESRNGSDAVISGKAAFDIGDGTGVTAPAFDESLLQKVRALPDVRVADGSVNGEAQLIGKDGKAIVYGGAPNLGFSIARGDSPFNPLSLVEGSWPKQNEVVIDKSTAGKEHFRIGQIIGVQAVGPVQQLRVSGIVKFGSVSTIGGATLAGFDLPTAQGLFGKPGKLDEIAVASEPNVATNAPVAADPEHPPCRNAGAHRSGAGTGGQQGHEFVHLLPPEVPAWFRRRRSLRRQLRDRELALDHHRAADARARDPQDSWRVPSSAAPVDHHRSAGDRNPRRRDRALRRARTRERAVLTLRRRWLHASEQRLDLRDPDGGRLARGRDHRHAPRKPAPGAACDACAADRRRSRRRHTAGIAVRPLPPPRIHRADGARLRRTALGSVCARPRNGRHPPLHARRSAARVLRHRAPVGQARDSARGSARVAGDEDRRHSRGTGPRELAAEPPAHRIDCVCAHDRTRPGDAGDDARGRDHLELRGLGETDLEERGLRDHRTEQLLADPDRGGRGRREDSRGRSGRERSGR